MRRRTGSNPLRWSAAGRRRTRIDSWYAPADAPFRLDLKGRAQFLRKYDLGLPFRVLREKKRQWLRQ